MTSQTLEPRIESSLLYTKVDGSQDFVHDTHKGFFVSREVIKKLENGTLDFVGLHNMIGFRGGRSVSNQYAKTYHFLREIFGDDYNPPTLNNILNDKDIIETANIGDHYGLGVNSKLLIRIKDDSYCSFDGQMAIAKLIEHIHLQYNVNIICVEGADGFIDTSWFKAFPDTEIRKEVCIYFMKQGEITGPEFLSITTDYPIILYGSEDRDLYIKEYNFKTKDEDKKSEDESKEESEIHMQRESVLVINTLTAMEKYNRNIAILVYGGGLLYDIDLSHLIKNGASYVLLKPKIWGVNWELHKKILRNERTPLEDILMGKQ